MKDFWVCIISIFNLPFLNNYKLHFNHRDLDQHILFAGENLVPNTFDFVLCVRIVMSQKAQAQKMLKVET